jgi:uncharacterized repeat protein (TIGR03803 family)
MKLISLQVALLAYDTSNGIMYGATESGGAYDDGAIYSLALVNGKLMGGNRALQLHRRVGRV